MTSWQAIWMGLDAGDRQAAAEALWSSLPDGRPEVGHTAVRAVARAYHMRPQSVVRLPADRRAKLLSRPRVASEEIARDLLMALHLHGRVELLETFLDALGVPHTRGQIGDVPEQPVEESVLAGAIQSVRSEFPAEQVETYLDCLEAEPVELWMHLPAARTRVGREMAPGLKEDDASAEGDDAPGPDVGGVGLAEEFTTLDLVLIEQVVDALQAANGALSEERLADLVDEVVHLDSGRHRSYFHAGFIDVLLDLEDRWQNPEMNPSRLGWYLCGAVTGHLRRGHSEKAYSLLRARPHELAAVGEGQHGAAGLALPQYYDVLGEHAGKATICSWLRPLGAARAGPGFLLTLLDDIKKLLRSYDQESAVPLLDVLEQALDLRVRRGEQIPDEVLAQVKRQRAHALRLTGDFVQARAILNELVAEPDQAERAMALADLGLIEAGYRALGNIRFPDDEADVPGLIGRLERGVDHFTASLQDGDSGGAHGAYALGLLLALRGESESERAVELLSQAIGTMQRHDAVYAPLGILRRARLGLALAICEALDPSRVSQVVEYTEAAVRDGAGSTVPAWLLRRILMGLATIERVRADELAQRLCAQVGGELLDPAMAAGLLNSMPVLRRTLLERSQDRSRPRTERFDDLQVLVTACRECGDRELQDDALDGLESLARRGTRVSDFIGMLRQGLHDPAWSEEEARTVEMSLLEQEGRPAEAASRLCQLGHALLRDADQRRRAEVQDIVSHVTDMGLAQVASDLKDRLQAMSPEGAGTSRVTRRGVVLVVGGNEVQEKYNEQLHAYVASTWPGVRLRVENTGWTSNWGRQLEDMEGVLQEAGAVVILTMIRTMLGRSLRRRCGDLDKPWVSCTGTGLSSLKRSIATAVSLL